MDSLIKVKNETIAYGAKLDSLHTNIENALEKKVKNRTIGEIILAAIALLAIIFH